MNLDKLKKMPRYQTEMVPYPISRFESGHISVTEGEQKTPVCILPLPIGAHKAGTERQLKNAEMIKRLPLLLEAAADVLVMSELSEKEFKRIQTKFKRLLKEPTV